MPQKEIGYPMGNGVWWATLTAFLKKEIGEVTEVGYKDMAY